MDNDILEVYTTAGVLRAYKSPDPGMPGICIMFQPAGYDSQIDTSFVSVYENKEYKTVDNERDTDIVIMTFGSVYTEDYTSKDIIRREDIIEAFKME